MLPKKLNRRYDNKIGKLNSAKIEGAEVKTRKAQLGLNHDLNEIIKLLSYLKLSSFTSLIILLGLPS